MKNTKKIEGLSQLFKKLTIEKDAEGQIIPVVNPNLGLQPISSSRLYQKRMKRSKELRARRNAIVSARPVLDDANHTISPQG